LVLHFEVRSLSLFHVLALASLRCRCVASSMYLALRSL